MYDLGDGTVAKVWTARAGAMLPPGPVLAAFYDELAGTGLPFATPRIVDIDTGADVHSGPTITRECHLPGRPLALDRPGQSPPLTADLISCLLDVLDAFRQLLPPAAAWDLPVMGEPQPLWAGHASFPDALTAAMRRRTRDGALAALLPELPAILESTAQAVAACADGPVRLVHGDLIPANILVDADLRPLAVLDFGLLTTAGPPVLDAAVAAATCDMYGPQAEEAQRRLTTAVRTRFGYAEEELDVFLAAYALLTGTAFSTSADDGHLQWCAAVLRRPRVRESLRAPGE